MAGVKNAIIAGILTIAICYSAGVMNNAVLIGFLKFWAFIVVLNVVSCICIEVIAMRAKKQVKVKDKHLDQCRFKSIITNVVVDADNDNPHEVLNIELLSDADQMLSDEIEQAARLHAKRKSDIWRD